MPIAYTMRIAYNMPIARRKPISVDSDLAFFFCKCRKYYGTVSFPAIFTFAVYGFERQAKHEFFNEFLVLKNP